LKIDYIFELFEDILHLVPITISSITHRCMANLKALTD